MKVLKLYPSFQHLMRALNEDNAYERIRQGAYFAGETHDGTIVKYAVLASKFDLARLIGTEWQVIESNGVRADLDQAVQKLKGGTAT